MCIAIFKPSGSDISTDTLRRCWTRHPHGGGLAIPDGDGGVTIHKAMTWPAFSALWDNHADPATPMLIHFRWATHGDMTLENCHPHRVSDNLAMIHNGVIRPMTEHASVRRSDTAAFVERVLNQIPTEAITSPGVSTLLENYIGRSRLVFLDGHGDATIVGEARGEWADDGGWYSNDTYRTTTKRWATRPLPVTSYPRRREGKRASEIDQRRAAAHELLDRHGPDLTLWDDTDLAVLAMAYEDNEQDAWEDVA